MFLLVAATAALPLMAEDAEITVRADKPGAAVASTMYGVFFEDINFAADGGLYAELVKNRSFEFQPDPLTGWQAFGKVSILDDGPFPRNPHYARLESMGHPEWWTGLVNEGYFGMGLRKDHDYRLSLYARLPGEGEDTTQVQVLRVQLIDPSTQEEKQEFVSKDIKVNTHSWKKYTVILRSTRTIERAQLRIFLCEKNGESGKGACDVEHVSLFPVDTWMGHENGLRKDLAQALFDMHPGVFRFPGGCIVEGVTLDNRYNWKNSVGPVENRPLNKNRWESTFTYRYFPDYFQSYGLGFFEFFQLSEEVGAEPLPILNVGMACQFQNEETDEEAYAPATKEGLKEFIDDCLDLIEFANGDTTTTWGHLRAEMGHPAPFNMKYLGIGNEQWEGLYYERLRIVSEAVRQAHPEIKLVGTSGPNSEGKAFDHGWMAMKEQKVDLVDEHFYRPVSWFKESWRRYDEYDRNGPKVFAGEYACHDKGKKYNHAGASIYEAAFMTGLERNADVVTMATYAPLFAHVDGWQWRPDAIWFNNLRSVRTVSYHVQAMFSHNKGTNILPIINPSFPENGEDGVLASAVWDKDEREVIVKVVNTCDTTMTVSITLEGMKSIGHVRTLTLDCSDYNAENSIANPTAIEPEESTEPTEGNVIKAAIRGKNFVIFKARA